MKTKPFILAWLIILSVLLTAFFNIESLLTRHDSVISWGPLLGQMNLTALSGLINLALLISFVIAHHHPKRQLLWLCLL